MAMDSESILKSTKTGHALLELQGITFSIVAGAAAVTNIPVTNIALIDTIKAVLEVDFAGTTITDRTSEASITSAGNIQLSTTATTGKQLLVIWFDKPDIT